MNIQNSFTSGSTISYSNSDYVGTCASSALSNLRVKLVDGNLEPIHFLKSIYVTINVEEIANDEKTEEEMTEKELQKETMKLIQDTHKKYQVVKEANNQKVERGVNVEPELPNFPEGVETDIREIKAVQDASIESNVQSLSA